LDGTFLYVAGSAANDLVSDPARQVLCKYALSDLVSTKTAPQALGHLNLYPNPATDWLYIQIPAAAENKWLRQLELVDRTGKVLRSQAMAAQVEFADLSLEGLPGGVYVVIFKQNGMATHAEQVVKQ
jgi:Secretion system C-terminal sorting domain